MGIFEDHPVKLSTESGSYPQNSPQPTTSISLYTTSYKGQTTSLSFIKAYKI